jgi:AraC family transcriptional regulator
MYEFEIRECRALRVAALMHIGPYSQMKETFDAVRSAISRTGMLWQAGPMVTRAYDRPGSVPEEAQRAHVGFCIEEGGPVPEDVEDLRIPGGRHAVLTYTGPYQGLADAWRKLYLSYLPGHGLQAGPDAPYEVYLNSPAEVTPKALVTELRVPLFG